MPSWKIHLTFNLIFIPLFWKIFLGQLFLENIFLFCMILFLYGFFSVFADLDTSKSKVRDYTSFILATIITFFLMLIINFNFVFTLPISFLLVYFFLKYMPTKHRGFTHSIKFAFIFPFFIVLIMKFAIGFSYESMIIYTIFLFLGYFFHIILDKI